MYYTYKLLCETMLTGSTSPELKWGSVFVFGLLYKENRAAFVETHIPYDSRSFALVYANSRTHSTFR